MRWYRNKLSGRCLLGSFLRIIERQIPIFVSCRARGLLKKRKPDATATRLQTTNNPPTRRVVRQPYCRVRGQRRCAMITRVSVSHMSRECMAPYSFGITMSLWIVYFDNKIEYVCHPADDASVCSRMSFWFVVTCGSHPSLLPSLQTRNLADATHPKLSIGIQTFPSRGEVEIRASTCLQRTFRIVQKARDGVTADTLRGKLF